MLDLNNVYNFYSSQIMAPKGNNRFQSHKRDDLKTLYNNMVKQNQHSPIYKFAFPDSTQIYAIGIKEAAMALEAESKALGSRNTNIFAEMMAVSDNENVIYASLRDDALEELPENLSIRVNALASGQTNVGSYLPSNESSFTAGTYSLGIAIENSHYTFNLTVHKGDTNQQIQRNLVNSINNNHIGVHAAIRHNRLAETSALVLRSDKVGIPNDDDLIFQFDETYLENDITSALGIDHVESRPANAEFYINDILHSSVSNRISLNYSMDIDLLATSDSNVSVYLMPDQDKISNKLKNFVNSYNQLVDIARNGSGQKNASRLFRDITGIAKRNQSALQAVGLTIDENGYLNKTDETDNTQISRLFDEELSDFRKDIKRTTDKMTLDPLDYIDKIIVTYPNTTGTYPNPYNPSRYSGLLFNDYA